MLRTRSQEKFIRANAIERIVQKQYLDGETDAADIALDELERDDTRTDTAIAQVVAMRINYP